VTRCQLHVYLYRLLCNSTRWRVSVFGFLNRFNDTIGTPLEDVPTTTGEKYLVGHDWMPGKHAR